MAQKAEQMLLKIINKWLCNVQLFPKVWILEILLKRFGYPDPYPVPVWKQFLDILIRLQTHYPAGYPTGKLDSDHLCNKAEVAGVTFSDSDSVPVPKFFNPAFLQISESDFCSDSGYNHWSNHNLPMFLPKKWPHRLLLLPKWKSDSGSGFGFSQIFESGSGSGSERETQNPVGIDSGNPDPVPPLQQRPFRSKKRTGRIK